MTLGSKRVPFQHTLHSASRDIVVCPRRAIAFCIGSDATQESPALLKVPSSPQELLGIELTNVAIDYNGKPGRINVCMRLTDHVGRPYGPAVPLAAFATEGAVQRRTATLRLPLPASQRVALFVATEAAGAVTATISGHALFQTHEAPDAPSVMRGLMNMCKNCGVPDTPTSSEAVAKKGAPSNIDTTTLQRKRSREDNIGTPKSTSVQRSEVPQLVPAFVVGGADES